MNGVKNISNIIDLFSGYKILQERGVPGLFQGFVSNGWRFVPGRAVYFSAYDSALGYLNGRSNSSRSSSPGESLKSSRPPPPPLYHCFLAGGFAGGVAWLSTYPFDVIRNRMQADAADPRLRKYRNMWHCAYEIAAQEGFHGYFKGLTVCLIRAIPLPVCVSPARMWGQTPIFDSLTHAEKHLV
eukprot:jgi/Bigna1/71932/fgenesh1_pg.17_\